MAGLYTFGAKREGTIFLEVLTDVDQLRRQSPTVKTRRPSLRHDTLFHDLTTRPANGSDAMRL